MINADKQWFLRPQNEKQRRVDISHSKLLEYKQWDQSLSTATASLSQRLRRPKKVIAIEPQPFLFLEVALAAQKKKEKKPKHFFHCTRRGQRLGQKCLWCWMLNFHTYCSVLVPDLSRKVFRNIRFIKFDSTSLPVNYVLKRNIVHVLVFLFLFLVNH